MLVDTGATKSFIDPEVAHQLFPQTIHYDPFIITSVFSESAHKYGAWMPMSKIFNLPNSHMKFHLFKFHNIFRGLIGLDNLKILKAKLDFETGYLITPNAKIKLQYQIIKNQINSVTIEPRVEKVIKVRTSIQNGEIIIPHTKLHSCEIPECITIAKNGYALTTVLNKDEKEISLDFSEPLPVEKFIYQESNFNNLNVKPFNKKPNLDLSKLRLNHLNEEERTVIIDICTEYADIFYNESDPLTFTNQIKHFIRTSDEIPVYSKTYRYPQIHKEEVHKQINKMLDQNLIQPSHSPWSSPIWVVPKKLDATGKQKWRVVIDYRRLNEKTIDDKYPLPNINDLLDKLGRCQYFTTLDLASGFHQIEMNKNDIPKTAFSTEFGLYEFLRMPFGLKNAPATFQRVMDNVLRGIQNEKCLVYLDDIIIFSVSLQEHINNLRTVFQRLRDTKFKIELNKSEFLRREVAYLGHIITPDGIKPNPDKVKAIKQFPIPKTTKQIKAFLGLLGYYRKFIDNFAHITKPLTKCLKKGAEIIHDDEFIQCFNRCKNLLINEPILQYPDYSKPFNLTTDASNVAIGAVLSQGPIGQDLPIAYASRTLNESEQNYSTIEKELLAIVYAVKYFRPYIFGRRFNIITDHKPLQWLMSLKEPNSKLIRWRLKLEEYDYVIHYKKGKLNSNADALSRVEINVNETNTIFEYIQKFNEELMNNPGTSKSTLSLIANVDESDLANDLPSVTQHSNDNEEPIVQIPITDSPLNVAKNQIVMQFVAHSPAKPKIEKFHDQRQRITVQLSTQNLERDLVTFIKEYMVPKPAYYIYLEKQNYYEKICEIIRKNFKWPSYNLRLTRTKLIDVQDKDEIEQIIENYHLGKTNHRGTEETYIKLKNVYFWPNMKDTIQNYITPVKYVNALSMKEIH